MSYEEVWGFWFFVCRVNKMELPPTNDTGTTINGLKQRPFLAYSITVTASASGFESKPSKRVTIPLKKKGKCTFIATKWRRGID